MTERPFSPACNITTDTTPQGIPSVSEVAARGMAAHARYRENLRLMEEAEARKAAHTQNKDEAPLRGFWSTMNET